MFEITTEKLINLTAAGESETVEFKESFGDEAIETIGAFANARGGTLLIGVKDSGEILGYQVGKKTLEDIATRIQEAADPRLQPSISTAIHDDKTIIVIFVSASTGTPASVKSRYFRRTGKTNLRMSHEEIMQKITASKGWSWDTVVEINASLKDLNDHRINHFVDTLKKLGRKPIPEQFSNTETLRKMKLIKNGLPTRAALLLFGNNVDLYFPSALLKLGRFRSPTHIVDDREIHGTLLEQLEGALNWFRERLETEFIITGNP